MTTEISRDLVPFAQKSAAERWFLSDDVLDADGTLGPATSPFGKPEIPRTRSIFGILGILGSGGALGDRGVGALSTAWKRPPPTLTNGLRAVTQAGRKDTFFSVPCVSVRSFP